MPVAAALFIHNRSEDFKSEPTPTHDGPHEQEKDYAPYAHKILLAQTSPMESPSSTRRSSRSVWPLGDRENFMKPLSEILETAADPKLITK